MGLFNKGENEKRPANPQRMMLIRVLAVGYLLYTVYDMIKLYRAGGEDAPSLTFLLVVVALFLAGCAWICVMTYKQWKQMQQQRQEELDEEDRLEQEQAQLEEQNEEDSLEEEQAQLEAQCEEEND